MLVLSRKIGDSVLIDDIVVSVVAVRGTRVRLAIDAPPDHQILRAELLDRKTSLRNPRSVTADSFEPRPSGSGLPAM